MPNAHARRKYLFDQQATHGDGRWAAYRERDEILNRLGFSSYRQYLQSRLWAKIRATFLGKNKTCLNCGQPATQIHHTQYTYYNLNGQSFRYLFPICRPCHEAAEFGDDAQKSSLVEANQKLQSTAILRLEAIRYEMTKKQRKKEQHRRRLANQRRGKGRCPPAERMPATPSQRERAKQFAEELEARSRAVRAEYEQRFSSGLSRPETASKAKAQTTDGTERQADGKH